MRERRVSDRRAVSDVLGFVLVFALIMTTVGTVSVLGTGSLTDLRDAERMNNAERAFEVLADNVADIHRRGAPSRATEIKLHGARLTSGEPTKLTVRLDNVDGTPTYSATVDPIRYEPTIGESGLVYEAGAVIREDPSGAVMRREPTMTFTDTGGRRTAVVPLVQTRFQRASGGDDSIVLVRTERSITEVFTSRTDPSVDGVSEYVLTIRVESTRPRAEVWNRYFESEFEAAYGSTDACGDPTGGAFECSVAVDRLHVTVTRIDVSFD